jgi:hypothetical protein
MNLTDYRYYTYGEGGLLKHRVDYSDVIGAHGEIIAVSPNGRNFLLKNISDNDI